MKGMAPLGRAGACCCCCCCPRDNSRRRLVVGNGSGPAATVLWRKGTVGGVCSICCKSSLPPPLPPPRYELRSGWRLQRSLPPPSLVASIHQIRTEDLGPFTTKAGPLKTPSQQRPCHAQLRKLQDMTTSVVDAIPSICRCLVPLLCAHHQHVSVSWPPHRPEWSGWEIGRGRYIHCSSTCQHPKRLALLHIQQRETDILGTGCSETPELRPRDSVVDALEQAHEEGWQTQSL